MATGTKSSSSSISRRKRKPEECPSDVDQLPQDKKWKGDESASTSILPGPADAAQAASEFQASQATRDDQKLSSDGTPASPKHTAAWKKRWQDIEDFRAMQYYMNLAGLYAISCPLIEQQYPGLDGELRLVIETPSKDPERQYILMARVDLGFMTGCMVMGPQMDALQNWCYKQQRREGGHIEEIRRLRDATLMDRSTENTSKETPKVSPPGTSIPLELVCECRYLEKQSLYMHPGHVLGDTGRIKFTGLLGLQFEGHFNLPMISRDPVKATGYKMGNQGLNGFKIKNWLYYDTSKVRYGAAWNGP